MVQAVPVHACRIPLGKCGQGWRQVQARVALGEHPGGHLWDRESPPKLHNRLSHGLAAALAGCHAHEQPDIHFPVPWQRNQTTKEKTQGQGHTPGPDWGPVFLQQETEKQPVTQGTGSPYIWPEGSGCRAPSAPVPSRWPASGCPELAFPNPVWKMLFI